MAEVKDKIVTVESLKTVHEYDQAYNQETYMTKVDPIGSGTLTMTGDGSFSGTVDTTELVIGNVSMSYDSTEGALKISFITE